MIVFYNSLMLRSPTLIAYIPGMKTKYLNLYTDYLISTTGYARATEIGFVGLAIAGSKLGYRRLINMQGATLQKMPS
ncbi:hypothetical protein, partial [Nitrosomonas communis]